MGDRERLTGRQGLMDWCDGQKAAGVTVLGLHIGNGRINRTCGQHGNQGVREMVPQPCWVLKPQPDLVVKSQEKKGPTGAG